VLTYQLPWICAFLFSSTPLSAQTVDRSFEIGFGAVSFIEYPTEFAATSCEVKAGGARARGSYWLSAILGIEGELMLTGRTSETCYAIGAPAPPDGVPFTRSVYDEHLEGGGFVATNVALLVEPFSAFPVSPRFRIGTGRLWEKQMGSWFYGGEVRFRFGAHALVMGVERWDLDFQRREEVVVRQNGTIDVQSFEIFPETANPYLVSVGWSLDIG
jgi:hypothetical protein